MSETVDTYLLLRAFCDELVRCGVTDACTSPGSRSTPLVLSLAREARLRTWSHVDERVSGFFALGLAKQTGLPVPIAVTSGTAAAELMPAVIEAHEARVPLIVLTADRPPELRDVGAGQTIDQIGLYGGAAKWFVEVGTHAATPARLRWMRALACRAVWTAADGRPGVVHLNVPLREPLVLDGPLPAEDPVPGRAGGRPWVGRGDGQGSHARGPAFAGAQVGAGAATSTPLVRPLEATASTTPLASTRRGVVVAGRIEGDAELVAAVRSAAERAGWPLLADPLSGARRGDAAVAHYDALLRDESLAGALRPDAVVRVGDLPTSKPLRTWLASLGSNVPQVAVDPHGAWHDPDSVVSERVTTLPALPSGADPAWLERWRAADAAAARAIAETIAGAASDSAGTAAAPSDSVDAAAAPNADADATDAAPSTVTDAPLNEPLIAAELTATLPREATLVVAASMPIRDVETFAPARGDGPRIVANRGANGIDGTVATALGAAAAGDGPVVLHIGDVALAYDLGALLSARRLGLDLAIVLVNNDGGGIFHFLAVAGERDAFEEHVATPHGLDFAAAATLYGARHVPVATAGKLRAELAAATAPGAGVTIVEARTDRDDNVALHRRVWAAVSAALAQA